MAGDWIKLETGTPFKPEVLRIAEMLGIDRQKAFGIVAEFWCWLDQNCRNGTVTHLSLQSIDSVTLTPGFAHAYADVGWGKLDLSTGKLTIINWDRHNGKSAKSRASTHKRVQQFRNANAVTKPLPEKRREELYNSSVVITPNVERTAKANSATIRNDKPKPIRWDATDAGIEAKGRELGVLSVPGEDHFTYKGRIWKAMHKASRGTPISK